ncbi:Cadmium/zinc-transporting ATPase hma2 [Asimina triloba]
MCSHLEYLCLKLLVQPEYQIMITARINFMHLIKRDDLLLLLQATAEMSSLMRMAPQKAVLAENGQVVDAKDVKVDTILAVKAGDVIPIDGIVVEGKSEVDEKTLTGESFPVAKQVNSNVWAGTLNLNGYISVKTTASADNSAVARMALLVEEAQHSKSKTQRLIDSCAKYYTPAVVLISAGVAVVPAACRARNLRYWFHLALVLLVNSCPCALILSTPVATFCALTKAATMGVLIKGGDYLESLAHIKIVAFDKTGTITKGQFTVTAFGSVSHDVSIDKLLYW